MRKRDNAMDIEVILGLLPEDFRLAVETARTISEENELKHPPELIFEFGKATITRIVSGDVVLAEREITAVELTEIRRKQAEAQVIHEEAGRVDSRKQITGINSLGKYIRTWAQSLDLPRTKERLVSWIENPQIPFPKLKVSTLTIAWFLTMIGLAAFPSWQVYQDRWADNAPVNRPSYDAIWDSWDFFSKLQLPKYFSTIFIALAVLLVLSLFQHGLNSSIFKSLLGNKIEAKDSDSYRVDENRQRRGRDIMVLSGAVLIVLAAIAIIFDSLPGIAYAVALIGFLLGGLLVGVPGERMREVWQKNALPWLAMIFSHLALVFFLSAIYSHPNLILVASLALVLSSLAVWNLRNRISPVFWVMSFALVIHTFAINDWWYAVIGDEYTFYRTAVEISERQAIGTINQDFFRGDYVYGTHPYISSFLQAIFIKVFGDNNFAWRFSSMYFSVLGIGLLYSFFTTFISKKPALITVLLLAGSQYLMGFGKIGYNSLQAFFALGLVLWAAAWAIRTKRTIAFVILGVAEGFCFYVFPAALYITPIPILLLLIYYQPSSKKAVLHWAGVLVASLVTIFPLLLQPEFIATRVGGTLYLYPELVETSSNIFDHLITNFTYALLSPVFILNESHFMSVGYTDLITAALGFLGFGFLFWRFWRNRFLSFVFISYIFLQFVVGTTHANEFPPNTRMFILLPWFVMLAVLGLVWISEQINNMGFSKSTSWRVVQVLVVIIIAVNLQQSYVVTKKRMTRYYYKMSLILRTAQEVFEEPGNNVNIMILYNPETMHFPSVLELLDLYQVPYSPTQVEGIEFPQELDEFALAKAANPNTLVILDPGLSDEAKENYSELLEANTNKMDCPIMVLEDVRYHMWYSEEMSWTCPPQG